MHIATSTPIQARHARLFELIRQQDQAAVQSAKPAQQSYELRDAQSFLATASTSLKAAT